jgi:hypothetical protein
MSAKSPHTRLRNVPKMFLGCSAEESPNVPQKFRRIFWRIGLYLHGNCITISLILCYHSILTICLNTFDKGFGKFPTRELNKKSIYLLVILFIIQILMLLHHNSRILFNHSILTICLKTFVMGFESVLTRELNKKYIYLLVVLFIIQILTY